MVRPLIGTWVRPNHLTALRLAFGLAACALLAAGDETTAAWSGALWIVSCVLDRADGELARMADLRSASGKVLDFFSDMTLNTLWFLGAGIGARLGRLGDLAIALGLLTSVSMLSICWFGYIFERLSSPGVKAWKGVRRFHPDDGFFLLAPLTWSGWLAPVLVGASLLTPVIAIIFIARYVALRRRTAAA